MPGPYFNNSKLLFSDGKLAMDTPCCCCCGPVEWGFTWTGFNNGDPWIMLLPWELEIHFEDSANCVTGGNSNVQTAVAKKCLVIDTDTASVTVDLNGDIEKQNPGYDGCTVKFYTCNGSTPGNVFHTVSQFSTGSGGSCTMENKIKSDNFAIPKGNYLVEVTVTTVDAVFHKDAVWDIFITIAP